MAKNPTTAELDHAVTLRLAGQPWKNVLPQTGLSHSQAEGHEMKFKMWLQANGLKATDLGGDWAPLKFSAESIKQARAAGISWGAIAIRMGQTESKVRKTFTEATGVHHTALRIGKGGRFLGDEQGAHLYTTDPATGTLVPATLPRIPELTEKGDPKGMKPEDRERLADLKGAIEARKAVQEKAAARRQDRKNKAPVQLTEA